MATKRSAQATRSNGEHRQVPAWIWLLAGLLIGLILAGVVFYKGWAPKLRDQQPSPAPVVSPAAETAAPIEAKPKYDFYSVLPEMEVVVPEEEIKSSATKPAALPADAAGNPQRFVLQAGSFRSSADADALKAKLALAGLRAQVLPVTVNGADWFRVRVGPFADLRELDAARQTLQANGVSAIALRDKS